MQMLWSYQEPKSQTRTLARMSYLGVASFHQFLGVGCIGREEHWVGWVLVGFRRVKVCLWICLGKYLSSLPQNPPVVQDQGADVMLCQVSQTGKASSKERAFELRMHHQDRMLVHL